MADPVPKDKGYTAVFEYIKNNMQSENCVREAFKYLEELSQSANKNSVSLKKILRFVIIMIPTKVTPNPELLSMTKAVILP